ncbi:MAG: hypothetical protein L3J16_01975 [Anaerolineales bacterium]|nr:hypothetical protein [Anaerolineales bacterium]
MKRTLIWAAVIAIALTLGVGGAALAHSAFAPYGLMSQNAVLNNAYGSMMGGSYGSMMGNGYAGGMMNGGYGSMPGNGYAGGMMNGGYGSMPGNGYAGGMMNGGYGSMPGNGYAGNMMGTWNNTLDANAQRLTLEQALESAQTYVASWYGAGDLEVDEIMEFESNFYVLFRETTSQRGAFELLVDPYSGYVSPEPGPNMMWNLKYSHMGYAPDNSTISQTNAREIAQQAVSANWANAEIEGDGVAFYGYYTFDYAIDGEMAGMLSVNSLNGQIFYHTWHGTFTQEKEY